MRQIKIINSFTNRNEESLDKYLVDISRIPMITAEEEVELAQAIRSGGKQAEKAREKLVSANLRFVVSFRLSLHIVIWYADLRIRLPSATRSRISADYASDKQVDYESMCSDLMMVLRSVLNERERIIVVQSFGIVCVIKCHLDRARALLARYRRDARTE